MQRELEELQPQLVTSAEENVKMMGIIEKESAEVEIQTVKGGSLASDATRSFVL